MDRYDMVSNET